jgi:hypothetical protein
MIGDSNSVPLITDKTPFSGYKEILDVLSK